MLTTAQYNTKGREEEEKEERVFFFNFFGKKEERAFLPILMTIFNDIIEFFLAY